MKETNLRQPWVAGQFYPSSTKQLNSQISGFINSKTKKENCIACMLPHAGYDYSGLVAGQTVSRVNLKEKIILLGPNHTGGGVPFSIMPEGSWLTPLGEVKIDSLLAHELLKEIPELQADNKAHLNEHSLEVELPFLQYFKTNFQIVPIAFASMDLDSLKKIGRGIASCAEKLKIKDSLLLVASSDMTHYEPQAQAEKKDRLAIESILELNEDKLFQVINEHAITMCGVSPVITMLSAAKALGAKKGELVKYQTSGDTTGDTLAVVGYAGIIIY
ncbi:MAG: AmmeMemoRadiSam system protein B [Candidatus Omnitrophica bacterium]|nr:AmmeMemoRadiSam system protein B [Candidatus Omnitrophota bacterium]